MTRRIHPSGATSAFGLTVLLSALALAAPASAQPATRAVRYHGYVLRVPAAWPVFRLASAPSTCVRFDRDAVYLGQPSAREDCPAHVAGRTEAILVRPLPAAAASGSHAPVVPMAGAVSSFRVRSAGVLVTATWSRHRTLVAAIVGRRLRAAPPARPRSLSAAHAALARAAAARALPAARAHASSYTGVGFDACTAPSRSAMSAWSGSPYRGVGVYIGGVNAACAQPNLNSGWVSAQVAAGWHLIPTYVGLQAPGACSGTCASISAGQASSQGVAAANDAVTQARGLGLPAGSPIYDDVEQYNRTSSNTSAVLAFLSGWTTQLHADGYLSGVYSSASSGITDLVSAYGTRYTEPDDVWIAHWNNQKTTSDSYVPGGDWPGATRLHQYAGGHNERYGGVTINIDGDYLNGATATATPVSPFPDGTFVQATGDLNVYRIAGGAAMAVNNWAGFGGAQAVLPITPQQLAALPAYPASGTFLTTTTGLGYRVAGGTAFPITNWALFGGQRPSVTVDEWDLQNVGNPLVHLLASPLNGTTVEGLPSGRFWSFTGGSRSASAAGGAVGVEDQALTPFGVVPLTGGVGQPRSRAVSCVAPQLKRLSLARTQSALRRAHCRLGHVKRPKHWARHHILRVFSQSVRARSRRPSGARINIRLR